MDPISLLLGLVPAQYLAYVALLVAVCAILDASLPQPAEGSPWVPARRAVAFVAINFAHARNAVPAGSIPKPVGQVAAQVQQLAASVESAAGELAAKAEDAAKGAGR